MYGWYVYVNRINNNIDDVHIPVEFLNDDRCTMYINIVWTTAMFERVRVRVLCTCTHEIIPILLRSFAALAN